jgi:maltooligosyltrehalose trehalohydrolase
MHIGTFTRDGTWKSAMAELPELRRLGVTVLEVMPVADFPGRFGWGYDGVNLFAPTRLYGGPDDFRAFVNQAHELGLGVILDVVYNHIGPDGNYLNEFSEDYVSPKHMTEWGKGLNFDGKNKGPVREFFVTNAIYWIQEFHLDGFRFDATHAIFDDSPEHIVAEIARQAREVAGQREILLVAENEAQEARFALPVQKGGYGLDALWNDDFHHTARVALTGRKEAYYSGYSGSPQELISAVKRGFLYQGQWFAWQKKNRGSSSLDLAPEQFVTFLQNHDQVANSLSGLRLAQLGSPGVCRALSALALLGPGTPLLFQGQEFCASAPFLYFADHHAQLARLVAEGRRSFLHQFRSLHSHECDDVLPRPDAPATFEKCKLDFAERERHRHVYLLHQDLLKLRREDPVFSQPRPGGIDGAVIGPDALVLRFFASNDEDRLLMVNLGVDLVSGEIAEPLLAPATGFRWALIWSSELPRYGGTGSPPTGWSAGWELVGRSAVVLAAKKNA